MDSRSEKQWSTWRAPLTTHRTTTMAMSLGLIGPEPSRRIRRRRQHRRVRQELQPSRTLSPVTSTIPITLPKSYALARTRSSKLKTCWRMSKMSSPRRPNRSSPKMQRTVRAHLLVTQAWCARRKLGRRPVGQTSQLRLWPCPRFPRVPRIT